MSSEDFERRIHKQDEIVHCCLTIDIEYNLNVSVVTAVQQKVTANYDNKKEER